MTEKSASWWQTIVLKEPHFAFYCKCEDDAFVHLDRLEHVLRQVGAQLPGRAIYFGHMKWRGWEAFHHFQACGGGWGPAGKTYDDMLHGAPVHGGSRARMPVLRRGPYPYMSGGMACMLRPLALILSRDAAFADFLFTAMKQNDEGTPCDNPSECARQPMASHMWHQEDAGIGFSVFRATVLANATTALVPVWCGLAVPRRVAHTRAAWDAEKNAKRNSLTHMSCVSHLQRNACFSTWW